MKRILLSMLAAVAPVAALVAAPRVVWLESEHNFGAFSEDLGHVQCTFMGVNTGDTPVVVISARANCGCTVPTYPREAVAPGDTIKIGVDFNAVGRPGRFSKKVYIDTGDGTKAQFTIRRVVVGTAATLAGRFPIAVGDARINKDIVPFGQTNKGRVLSGAVNIYNSTDHPITPEAVDLPPYIKAKMHPATIPVGDQGTLSLTALTDMAPDYGTVTGRFRLIPDKEHPADTVGIRTVMILNEDFSKLTEEQLEKAPRIKLSADKIDFDSFDASHLSRSITLTNEGKEPLLIRRAECGSELMKVDVSTMKVKPGKSATIKVTLSPGCMDKDMIDERILLIVNDPKSSKNIIRVVGIPSK